MKTPSNRQLRRAINAKGLTVLPGWFPFAKLISKRRCRKMYWDTGNPHWMFRERYGYVILNMTTVELYNKARMKNGMKKLRVRDLNRMCIFKFPKRMVQISKP